ncbi:MAG TPA: HAD family hydrolase [Nitrososphaerales archaeon]|nr:HAD family hydrolase [Nitrososphaerales archaeon]
MKTRAVFFDLGGTLLVMRRDRIFRKVLREAGRDADLERIRSAYMKAESWWVRHYSARVLNEEETAEAYRDLDQKVFAALFPGESETEAHRVSKLVRSRWAELETEIPLELYPDVEPVLDRLWGDGYTLGLISNAPADTVRVVDALGLTRYLGTIVISGVVGYTKPHPEIFRIALREAGVEASEAIHVGDLYEADVVGARNAGMEGILIDRDASDWHPDCPRVRRLSEIRQFIK